MTYDRYDRSRGRQDPRSRSHDDDRRPGRDERGFFDRARDEVSSWFGDDDADRRRERDEREEDGRYGRPRAFAAYPDDRFEGGSRWRDDTRRPYTGRFQARGQRGEDYERPYSENRWERSSPSAGFTAAAGSRHDHDYSQWRSRQIDELDRDYNEFRRENASRFENEFSTWREQRQTKRQLLGNVTEHMDVVGSDNQPVGKVDWVKGDKIVLTKSDSEDGRHHTITCAMVDKVEDGKVTLDRKADECKREFASENRDRALFERDEDREDSPHILGRSFSGTY